MIAYPAETDRLTITAFNDDGVKWHTRAHLLDRQHGSAAPPTAPSRLDQLTAASQTQSMARPCSRRCRHWSVISCARRSPCLISWSRGRRKKRRESPAHDASFRRNENPDKILSNLRTTLANRWVERTKQETPVISYRECGEQQQRWLRCDRSRKSSVHHDYAASCVSGRE